MTILFVVPWEDAVGGVTYVAGNLARYLHDRGHQIFFLLGGKSVFLRPKLTNFGFPGFELRMQAPLGERNPVISLSVFLLLFPITLLQVIGLLLRYRIHVINIHFPEQWCLYLALSGRLLRTVLVTSIHGADVFRNGTLSGKLPWPIKLILRASSLIVAPSQQCRKYLVNALPDVAGRTRFIHNGVDLDRFDKSPQQIPEQRCGRYILCVSACKQQKALDVLIDAFKIVSESLPSFNLVVVGDGPLRQELEALTDSLNLKQRIQFLGYQTAAQVANLLHGCELFVLPSRFETFGIAVLEAMACRKPVVATTAGGIPEIIKNSQNGILVEPDDPAALAEAMLLLLKDPGLQQTIAKNGRATVETKFRWESTGRAYEDAFSRLIESATDLAYTPAP
jgi:glycosyltransferase involved in cell wall biosynthesis